jgi:K+-transporting ATPase ATPase A chain
MFVGVSHLCATKTGVVQMTIYTWLQIGLYLLVLLLFVKPLGAFMARVYQGEHTFLTPIVGPVERFIYRIAGLHPDEEMEWKTYALAMGIILEKSW